MHKSGDSGGNVGIGTTTPAAALEINRGSVGGFALRLSSAVSGWGACLELIDTSGKGKRYGVSSQAGSFQIRGEKGTFLTIDANLFQIGGDKGNLLTVDSGGNLLVANDVVLTGGDCAEEFDSAGTESAEPGTVMVIDQKGALRESSQAYDKRVAGVVSGAGEFRHAIVLDRRPQEESRVAVALLGKVYCQVDADYSPVQVGDLLTTSPTPGHAMKATDPLKAFGSVIGKAMAPLGVGRGLIPILIALQ